ncbi:Cro/CI family transcriptional regulator [Hydrocarboniphaga sp.]|uniref:Cro/CI family transcriptional regulator n=1 Tax=Hydrocarboniphaga sp. TaxID=2033016 RepID=UPI003D0F7CB7
MDSPLDKAINAAGGAAALARYLDVAPSAVTNWRLRKQVPAERCRAIEAATQGAVTRYALRPDVFGSAPADVFSVEDFQSQEPQQAGA